MPVFFANGINFVLVNFDNCCMIYSNTTACATADLARFDWITAWTLSNGAQVTLVPFRWSVIGSDLPVTSLKFTNISRKVIPQSSVLGLESRGHFRVPSHWKTSYAASIPHEQHWAIRGVISGKSITKGLSTVRVAAISVYLSFFVRITLPSFCCSPFNCCAAWMDFLLYATMYR